MVAVDLSGAACAARRRAVFHAMGLKTMQRSLAFPPVLTSYKLLEIERPRLGRAAARRATAAGKNRKILGAGLFGGFGKQPAALAAVADRPGSHSLASLTHTGPFPFSAIYGTYSTRLPALDRAPLRVRQHLRRGRRLPDGLLHHPRSGRRPPAPAAARDVPGTPAAVSAR